MSHRKLLQHIVGVTLGIVFLVACGSSAPKAEIETSQGTIIVQEVQLTDRFPPDCTDESATCDQAQEGYRHLIVWMGWSDAAGPGISVDALGKLTTFTAESGEAYVTSGGGSQIELGANGMEAGRLFLLFRVPNDARDFTLYWPNNPPVDLGK
jgi:hypothetical protein